MFWLWVAGYVAVGAVVALVSARVGYNAPEEGTRNYKEKCEEAAKEAATGALVAGALWPVLIAFFVVTAPFFLSFDGLVKFAGAKANREVEQKRTLEEAQRIVDEYSAKKDAEFDEEFKKLEEKK